MTPPPETRPPDSSDAVIHIELDRVRGHAQAHDVGGFQLDIGVNQVVGKDPAGRQETTIGIERIERFVERLADFRNALRFLGRQVVKILVHRVTRMKPVLNAVEAGHHHGCEGEIRVAGRAATSTEPRGRRVVSPPRSASTPSRSWRRSAGPARPTRSRPPARSACIAPNSDPRSEKAVGPPEWPT